MKRGDALPNGSTVLRTAKAKDLLADPPVPAFILRPKEPDLSVQWLEYFSESGADDRLRKACHKVGQKPNRSGFVLFVGVDAARANLLAHRLEDVRILYTPSRRDKSHSSVVGVDILQEQDQLNAAVSMARAIRRQEKWGDLVDRGIAPDS